jgi:hypothetical protein
MRVCIRKRIAPWLVLVAGMAASLVLPVGAMAALPDAGRVAVRTLRVAVPTPSPCWGVQISAVYRTQHDVLVVAQLEPPPANTRCPRMVSMAEDTISLAGPALPVRHLIVGRTWGWQPDLPEHMPSGTYVYVRSRAELQRWLEGAKKVK